MRGDPVPRGGERQRPNPIFLAHAAALTDLYVALQTEADVAGLRLQIYRREGDAREAFTDTARDRALAPDAMVGPDRARMSGSSAHSWRSTSAPCRTPGYARRPSCTPPMPPATRGTDATCSSPRCCSSRPPTRGQASSSARSHALCPTAHASVAAVRSSLAPPGSHGRPTACSAMRASRTWTVTSASRSSTSCRAHRLTLRAGACLSPGARGRRRKTAAWGAAR